MFSSTCIRPLSKVATLGGFCGLAVAPTACMEGLISGGLFFFAGDSDGDGGSVCSGGGLSEVGGLRGGAAGVGVVG